MPEFLPLDEKRPQACQIAATRTAISYLHQQSIAAKNPDVTALIGEALQLFDSLAADGQATETVSPHAVYYLHFLTAILGLPSHRLQHLIAMLQWLKIIPDQLPA